MEKQYDNKTTQINLEIGTVRIMGSSNARGIKLTKLTHLRIQNNCIGGATAISFKTQFNSTNPNNVHNARGLTDTNLDFYIIFQGPNQHNNRDWDSFRNDFRTSIQYLKTIGLPASRTIIIGPLPRGNDENEWKRQMKTAKHILADMHQMGLHTIDIYNELPHDMRTPNKIFGKKDIRLGHYVHYGQSVLDIINTLTENKLLELKRHYRKGTKTHQ